MNSLMQKVEGIIEEKIKRITGIDATHKKLEDFIVAWDNKL